MNLFLLLDVAIVPGAAESSAFVVFLVGAFVLIVGLETIVLWLLSWGGFRRSLRDALLMNFVTTLVGAVGLLLMPVFVSLLAAAFALSVWIEGLILLRRRREQAVRRVWLTALVANAVSYALVFFLPGYFG